MGQWQVAARIELGRAPLTLGRTFLTARNFAEISAGKERSRCGSLATACLARAGQPQQQARAAQRAVLQRGSPAVQFGLLSYQREAQP
jgi:hypothetical protein